MLKLIPIVFFIAFGGQSLARTMYVNHFEFEPARLEWEAAHTRGDRAGMWRAYYKEELAHCRTFDPLWWSGWGEKDCSEYERKITM